MTRRILTAWLAIAALALQAPWPPAARAGGLMPLCTAQGAVRFVATDGGAPAERGPGAFHEHCALCALGAERLAALPPAPAGILHVEQAPQAAASRADARPAVSRRSPPAQPRAPPARS